MAANKFQSVMMKLVGIFDCRSSADEKPPGSFAWKENLAINPDGRLSRALGWLRYGSQTVANNQDWHDQDVALAAREPVTMMFASVANDLARRLFIGTKTRLFVLNEALADYSLLVGGPFGSDGSDSLTQTRFNAAELQNKVVFTNNLDVPQIHTLGTLAVADIATLATVSETGGALTAARKVIAWQGLMFLLNTVEDGVRHANRIRWSDFNDANFWSVGILNPTSGANSIADFQDLDPGENILNAIPLAGALYVFTDRSIWRCSISVAADEVVLSCVKVYTEPRNRAKCLAYPNALISTGFSVFYLGSDGVYEYNPYLAEPDRVEWIHRATPVIFKNPETRIDKLACNSPIMEFVPGSNEDATAGNGELHISWPAAAAGDGGINSQTLVLNTKYRTCDFRAYGSTAMVNFTSDLNVSGDCNQQSVLLSENGEDWTIKQLDIGAGREMFDPATGLYTLTGYYSIARLIFPFERFADNKNIKSFLADVYPIDPLDPAMVKLRIGTSDRALDPNPNPTSGFCEVLWHDLTPKPMKCSYTRTAAQYVADNVRPDNPPVQFNFYFSGRFLMVELTITAADGSAPTTGLCNLSRFEVETRLA